VLSYITKIYNILNRIMSWSAIFYNDVFKIVFKLLEIS